MPEKAKHRPESGLASVQEGQIKIVDPPPGGEPATITPAEGITLKINGSPVTTETEVTENDEIIVEPETETVPARLNIVVSEDKMKAYLEVIPEVKKIYRLKDRPPARRLRLETEQVEKETVPFGFAGVMSGIRQQGITRVNEKAVKDFFKTPKAGKILIASGVLPVPPRDEKVDVKFSLLEKVKPVIRADGRVDFREMSGKITSVKPGDIIAEKIPGSPGKPGIDVYGKKVQPGEPQKVVLHAGSGVELSDGDTRVVAVFAGQPEVKESGTDFYFSVQSTLEHKGNVNMASGNLRFTGNIHVKGNVEEGMLVSSSGKVQIDGMVSGATVVAGDDLAINGHVLASKIQSGAAPGTFGDLLTILGGLEQDLTSLQTNLALILPKIQGKASFGKIVSLLIEKNFPTVRDGTRQLLNIVDKNSRFPREIEQLAANLRQKFWGINILQLTGMDDLKALAKNVQKTKSYLQALLRNKANARFEYALNSVIEATGEVCVTGQGCIDTRITAGGPVFVKGIFRGGSIEAQDNVFVEEAGSKVGVLTRISVPEGKSIFLTRAFENVSLQVGALQVTLHKKIHKKEIRMDIYEAIEFADWDPQKETRKDRRPSPGQAGPGGC